MKRFLDEKTDWPGGQPKFWVDTSTIVFGIVFLDEGGKYNLYSTHIVLLEQPMVFQ